MQRDTYKHTYIHTYIHTCRHTDIQTGRRADGHRDWCTGRKTGRQARADTDTYRQTSNIQT